MKLSIMVVALMIFGVSTHAQIPADSLSIPKQLKRLCKKYSRAGDYNAAYVTAEKLKAYAITSLDTVLLLNSYFRLGFYAKRKGDFIQSLEQFNQGIYLNVPSSLEEYKLPILSHACEILNIVGDYPEAQKYAIKGIEISKSVQDLFHTRDFYNELAVASVNNQQFDAAKEAYQSALEYTTSEAQKITILNNMGVYYKNQKEFQSAAKLYDSILNNFVFDSAILRAKVESNLGFALTNLGKRERALPLLIKALEIREKENKYDDTYASYVHLTKYYAESDKLKAISFARKAYNIAFDKLKSPIALKEALFNIISLNTATDNEVRRYAFLTDSIQRAEKKTISDYAVAKFRISEREIEIANQKERIAREEKQNSYYISGIIVISIGLICFLIYAIQRRRIITRNYKIETLEARENERNKVSGKVHDYVAYKIREVMQQADHLEVEHPGIGFSLLGDKVESAYQELRKVSQDYMPIDFDKIDFPERVQGLLTEREEQHAIVMDAKGIADIDWAKVTVAFKTELFRSLQELLLNISKHAEATVVTVIFRREEKQIKMTVIDNGVGCDFEKKIENTGLTDLRRRISNLEGEVKIVSELNKGFQVELGIPLK